MFQREHVTEKWLVFCLQQYGPDKNSPTILENRFPQSLKKFVAPSVHVHAFSTGFSRLDSPKSAESPCRNLLFFFARYLFNQKLNDSQEYNDSVGNGRDIVNKDQSKWAGQRSSETEKLTSE